MGYRSHPLNFSESEGHRAVEGYCTYSVANRGLMGHYRKRQNTVSRVLFRKTELTEFCGKLGEFCAKLD